MENFMPFDANDQQALLLWFLGGISLAALFVFTIRSLRESIGYVAQLGLFIIFLLIGALTSTYFYLILPLYCLMRVVVVFAARKKAP